MKKVGYLFWTLAFILFFNVVNAETIGVRRIGDTKDFNVILNDISNTDTINVVEGTLNFNKKYIDTIEVVSNSKWKFKTLVKENEIKFVSYLIGDFAKGDDVLFKVQISFYEDADLTKEELNITDIITNNGKDLFEFKDIKFKYKDVQADGEVVSQSIPSVIGKEEVKVELPDEELLENQQEQELLIPEEDIIAEIKENKEESTNNGVLAIVVCITCLIISIVVNSIIHLKTSRLVIRNNEEEIELSNFKSKINNNRKLKKQDSNLKGDAVDEK